MTRTALVVTTVHWPDDTRIRERLIRTLSSEFRVRYAARSPGSHDRSDHDYVELAGGRIRRNLKALSVCLRSSWDLMVIHDPELLPTALLVRGLRRKPVVFDVHEDFPAVARTRTWVPHWLRTPLAWTVAGVLRVAEAVLTITLAEGGYGRMFRHDHPVFPNHPDSDGYPPVQEQRRDEAVYLGDGTLQRGVDVAIGACSKAGVRLRVIGRVAPEVEAGAGGNKEDIIMDGTLPNPDAIRLVSGASVGLVPLRDTPNYRHSQPTKLLEYLAVGVPVVASNLPGTRELVEGLEAVWLVEPGDVDAMASAISEARLESATQAAVDQAGLIRQRYRWPAEEVVAFYRSLISP